VLCGCFFVYATLEVLYLRLVLINLFLHFELNLLAPLRDLALHLIHLCVHPLQALCKLIALLSHLLFPP
jgi:hypothetical protein